LTNRFEASWQYTLEIRLEIYRYLLLPFPSRYLGMRFKGGHAGAMVSLLTARPCFADLKSDFWFFRKILMLTSWIASWDPSGQSPNLFRISDPPLL
jgi:hypothetical protein